MVKRIFKYPLEVEEQQYIEMPKDSKVISVQLQQDELVIWAIVDESKEIEERLFVIYETGEEIPDWEIPKLNHIGTIQMDDGDYVIHIFSRL